MNKSFKTHSLFFIFTALLAVFIYACSDDPVTPTNPTYDAKSINGTITFVETGFMDSSVGSYLVAAYPRSGWPPMGGPAAFVSLPIVAGQVSYNYKLVDLPDGAYVVSVGFRKNTGGQSPIMGIYGCDTARFPSSPCLLSPSDSAVISNTNGVGNINFLSWADTTNKIF